MYDRILAAALLLLSPAVAALDLARAPRWEDRMLDEINDERSRRGLPRLRADRRLASAAAEHSRRMASAGRLAHRLRGEPELTDRVAATGLRFDAVGENVGYSTRPEELHRNLMRSRGHRRNLLSTRYDTIGIAIYQRGQRFYVTQDFARSTSEASAPEAERIFADAVAALRRERGLPAVAVDPTGELRDAACAMAGRDDLDAKAVPHQSGQRHAVAFTSFEPGELTGAAREVATDPRATRLTIGACHRESPTYPSGVFWFAVAY